VGSKRQKSINRDLVRPTIQVELISEFLAASLYYSPETNHHDLLSKIMGVFEEDKPSGGLPRELLDIGIRSALKAGKTQEAVRLARTGKGTVSLTNDEMGWG